MREREKEREKERERGGEGDIIIDDKSNSSNQVIIANHNATLTRIK